ncbi:MAG: cupin domain-containing protein [Campylobacterales bacterium]
MKELQTGFVNGNHRDSESIRQFLDGSVRSSVALRSAQWSRHAGPQTGRASENHIGYILSGRMKIQDAAGTETEVGAGDAFEVGPGSDAWVVGDEPCVALDFIPL